MTKLLLFLFLATLTFSQTIQLTANQSTPSSQAQPLDVVIGIPVTNLTDSYQYIKQLIETYLPEILQWQLTQIMKVNDSTHGVVYYLYRYVNSNGTNGTNDTGTVKSKDVLVLQYQDNSYVVVDAETLVIAGQTTRAAVDNNTNSGNMGQTNNQQTANNNVQASNNNQANVQVGGFSQTNTNNLDTIQLQAQQYLLASVPKLNSWNLIDVKMQIVSGQNNCFTYQNPVDQQSEMYCVWSQPWNNNFMQLTLPNGTIMKTGGNL